MTAHRCGWCEKAIRVGSIAADPYSFRGWHDGRPVRLDVPLRFHRRCWVAVTLVADAAESWAGERPADPPLTSCECGADTYPGVDHHCAGVAPLG